MYGLVDAVAILGGFIVILLVLRRINNGPAAQPDQERTGPDPDETEYRFR